MPTIEDITKILSTMDADSYRAAVKFIYYLADDQKKKENDALKLQQRFVDETAGKVSVDMDAINELRMRSMI